MAKEVLDLTGDWEFREYPAHARRMRDLNGAGWMPARVPSSIYTSLTDAGIIDETELRTSPENFVDISEKPWIYKKVFDCPESLLQCPRIDLHFEGLDTVTQIWLNDKLIARTDNMFIGHRFDVTALLKKKNNRLLVKFNSAIHHAQRLMNRYGKLTEFYFGYPCRSYIRKAQYQFGWDWCPPLPGCGIFRPVRLEGITGARIADFHVRTIDCNENYADVAVALKLETEQLDEDDLYPLTCELKITDGVEIRQTLEFHPGHNRQSTIVRIENPRLWWPNGQGEQHLYKLSLELSSAGTAIDSVEKQFGIRTAHLNRAKDKRGETFQFDINHQPVYAKGANWIPLTIFPGSQTRADYEQLLQAAVDANINMLRVWGGGYYENEEFYELCDQLGIMVWQDFMFACSYYPDRQWFLDMVKTEAADVIKRLRNHPSVVLWCGNNEIHWQHSMGVLGRSRKFYGKTIYENLLPRLVAELDSQTDYIPTTPLAKSGDANAPTSGTVHQWRIWSGREPARNYATPDQVIPRFVTEFGLQSLPDIATVKTFCPQKDLRIASHALEKHNHQLDGNSRLYRYLTDIFAPPQSLEEFAYLSQLTQAREIKRYVEHLRAHNEVNKGVLFWQFNDCCGAISWSAIDSQKKPKALYHYARRFFAPVLVTLLANPHRYRPDLHPTLDSAKVVVINDSHLPVTATLQCRLIDLTGNTLDKADFPVVMAPHTRSASLKLPATFTNPDKPSRSIIVLTLEDHERIIAQNTFTPLPDKYMDWPLANVSMDFTPIDSAKWNVEISSDAVTPDLQITSSRPAAISDNYFTLTPQTTKHVTIDFTEDVSNPQPLLKFRSLRFAT